MSLPSAGARDVLKECVEPKVNYGLSKPKKTCLLTFLKLVSKMDSNEPENGKELQLGMPAIMLCFAITERRVLSAAGQHRPALLGRTATCDGDRGAHHAKGNTGSLQ